MIKNSGTYYVTVGASCDYGHKERASAAAWFVELEGKVISEGVISELHTTEFRIMLSAMLKVMDEFPAGSDIVFLTNASYVQNFDRVPGPKTANADLISQCIEHKKRHKSVSVKIVPYHKSPLLVKTHDLSSEAMKELRNRVSAGV